LSFVPSEELKCTKTQTLAPMIDFLFIMLMFFASLAISRVNVKETMIDLVKVKEDPAEGYSMDQNSNQVINIIISENGEYKWITDIYDYEMADAQAIKDELLKQHELGQIPTNKSLTKVLLKIDKAAPWDPIMQVIFTIRDAGFEVRPIYLLENT
jgi:biopolymer transport protein ExbD